MAKGFDIKWNGKEVFMLATKANVRAMNMATKLVELEVKKELSRRGSFKPYKRGTKIHWSSKEGDPPAPDTGILMSSIASFVKKVGLLISGKIGPDIDYIAVKGAVGTDVDYGLYLELGTRNMAARPFLRPTINRLKKKINKIFEKANS